MADEKIYIDVLTLDSVQCAACGYMMESIAALPGDVQDMIEYTEWSIKNKDGVGKFLELKGKVLPTICRKISYLKVSFPSTRNLSMRWPSVPLRTLCATALYRCVSMGSNLIKFRKTCKKPERVNRLAPTRKWSKTG